nr:MAG TPA_asm: hypothetical protein [Caudoviricetes sp.]
MLYECYISFFRPSTSSSLSIHYLSTLYTDLGSIINLYISFYPPYLFREETGTFCFL